MAKDKDGKVKPETEEAWRDYKGRIQQITGEELDPEVEKFVRLGFCAGYQERWNTYG